MELLLKSFLDWSVLEAKVDDARDAHELHAGPARVDLARVLLTNE